MKRPFVPLGITMFISLLVFGYFGFYSAVVFFALGLVILVLTLFLFRKEKYALFIKALRYCCIAVIVSAFGFCLKTVVSYEPAIAYVDDLTHDIEGTLTEYSTSNNRFYYTVKTSTVDGEDEQIKVRVSSSYYLNADIDDTISFSSVTLYTLGATESSARQYKAGGVYIGAYGASDFNVTKADSHSLTYYINELRQYISSVLQKYMPADDAATANAMLIGDKTDLDDEINLNFKYSGIAHLLAVSGFHLSLWTSIISGAFDKVFKRKTKLSAVFSILLVIFYMALTGFTKSVVRAGIMLILTLTGKLFKYRADVLNSLFVALTVMLTVNPFLAESISLQMSAISTVGIILLGDVMSVPMNKLSGKIKNRYLKSVLQTSYSIVTLSIVASLFTMPVCIYQFGYFSLIAPVTNLLTSLPAEIMIFLSGLGIILSGVGALAKPIFLLASLLGNYIIFITDKIAKISGIVVNVDSDFLMFLIYAILVAMFIFAGVSLSKNKTKNVVLSVLVTYAAIIVVSLGASVYNYNSVTIITEDVGNGTAVIVSYKGKTCVVGCGGDSYDEYTFTNTLNKYNSRTIDYLLIPRATDTESEYASTILTSYDIESAVVSIDNFAAEIVDNLPENSVITNGREVDVVDDLTISYISNDDFCGARITTDDFDCTVIFKPTVDFDYAPSSWSCGDLLITRSKPPLDGTDNFDNIFVSTNLTADSLLADTLNENVYLTSESGCLTLRVSPFGTITINEENS